MEAVVVQLLQTFGPAGAVFAVMWWVIKTQRSDLMAERARNDVMSEKVFALAHAMQDTVTSIREAVLLTRKGR